MFLIICLHFSGIRPTADENLLQANQLRYQQALLSRRAELCPPDDVTAMVTPIRASSSAMPAGIVKSITQQQQQQLQRAPSDFRQTQPVNDHFSTSVLNAPNAAVDHQAAASETMMDESSRRQRRRNKFYGTDEEPNDSRTTELNATSERRHVCDEARQQTPIAMATPVTPAVTEDRRQQQTRCETAEVAVGRHQFTTAGEKVTPAAAVAREGRRMRVHEGGADASLAASKSDVVTATVVKRADATIGTSMTATAAPMSPTSGRRVASSAKSGDHRVPSFTSATTETTLSVRQVASSWLSAPLECDAFRLLASKSSFNVARLLLVSL